MKRRPGRPNLHKGKCNLTVSPEFRAMAEEVALHEHRTLSNLFEYLVAREHRRLFSAESSRLNDAMPRAGNTPRSKC